MIDDEEKRRKARRVAEARYGFLWHLPIYIVVNLTLVAIWYYSGAGIRTMANLSDILFGNRRIRSLRIRLPQLERRLDRKGN